MNQSEWSRQNQSQKPITMQLIRTLYFQFNDDFHDTILFYRLQTIPSIVLLVTIPEVLSNSLSISTHRVFHCSQTHFIQISGFSFNAHKSNPNSEFHFHSIPLTHYSSTNQDITRRSSTIKFIHLIEFIQSLPIYRMIKHNTILF